MSNEMAHYTSDCWDAEIQNSYGWPERVGCPDRVAYDLCVHSKRTGQTLIVREALKEPIVEEREVAEWNKKAFGQKFRDDAGKVQSAVEVLLVLEDHLKQARIEGVVVKGQDGQGWRISTEAIIIESKVFKQSSTLLLLGGTPNMIGPSFGFGHMLYALLEHSFWARKQDVGVRPPHPILPSHPLSNSQITQVLSLPPVIAHTKVLVIPLGAREEFVPFVQEICASPFPPSVP